MSPTRLQNRIAEFLAAERSRLVSYVRRLIDDTADRDGEDIVQEVALSLFSRADVSMPIENLSAYFYQAIRNRVIDHLRQRKSNISLDDQTHDSLEISLAEVLSDPALSTEDQVHRSEIGQRIFEAIDNLPDEQKAVLIETELNGRTFRELSLDWGLPLGTLLARKSRAVAKVRTALSDLKP